MTKKICFLLFVLFSLQGYAQTGIGTSTPHASAKLDVSATNKGFLPPRITLTSYMDNTTIPNPAIGLFIYNTGDNVGLSAGYYYWNGNAWATIATAGGSGSMAAEFGSQIYTSAPLFIPGTNLSDVLSFQLPSAGTWEVITSFRTSASGAYAVKFALFDASGTKVANSEILSAHSSGAAGSTGTGVVRITTTASAVYYLKANLADWSANACYVNSDANGRTGVTWQKISGNALVTGQSVDYVSVVRTTGQTVNAGDNLIFNTTNSGNIPYNSATGNFTLTAGKTYRLTGSVSMDGSTAINSAIDIAWKTAAGEILGNRGLTISTNYNSTAVGNGLTDIVYTPTINTTVSLNVISSSANAKTVPNYTYANITQIGSSAIVNPWILSGTDTYNTTGNVGIGTTSPAAKLHLSNSGAAGLELSPTGGASGGTFIQAYNRSTIASVPLDIYASQIAFYANDVERMRITSGGNVGIGTNAPSSSALLDLTSASKGLLPPRVALTSKSGTSTPIASPTNGLLIYNTANAGSGGDAVTPGYYYFNGTIWTRMDPEGWSTPVSITIGATTTAPLKGTATTDYVRYRNIGGKEYEVEYNLVRTVAGSAGSGDYLISLPGGLQFDFTATGQRAYTLGAGYNAIVAKLLNVNGDLYYTGAHNSATVIPYNATSFRVHTNNWGTNGWTFWNASYYQLGDGSSGFKMTFRFIAI